MTSEVQSSVASDFELVTTVKKRNFQNAAFKRGDW